MECWGDLSNSILRPEILHGTLYMPKEWENEAWCLIFNKTIFLTHSNGHWANWEQGNLVKNMVI